MTNKKRRKKRLRLKSSFKRFCVYFLFFLIVGIYAIQESFEIHKLYEYRKTNEYKILALDYTQEETDLFLQKLDEKQIAIILENEYNEDYYHILKEPYYLAKNFEKYIEYKKEFREISYKDCIAIVNTHVNEGWYNVSFETDTSKGNIMLVNKFYHLNEEYERADLENVSLQYAYEDNKAASEVIEAFERMRNDVREKLNVSLMINSSYRSYKVQEETYISFRKNDNIVARPGYSEHQTGLTLDLTSIEHPMADDFTESEEYKWLIENCHYYGFILRYPENKKYITGYDTESWHFRYVGLEHASKMYQEDLTLEEYYAYYIEK